MYWQLFAPPPPPLQPVHCWSIVCVDDRGVNALNTITTVFFFATDSKWTYMRRTVFKTCMKSKPDFLYVGKATFPLKVAFWKQDFTAVCSSVWHLDTWWRVQLFFLLLFQCSATKSGVVFRAPRHTFASVPVHFQDYRNPPHVVTKISFVRVGGRAQLQVLHKKKQDS